MYGGIKMKKIACALLSVLFITPSVANIHISSDAVVSVIASHFPDKQVECLREYNSRLKAANGSGIAAADLWNVCYAGGLDIKQASDKEKCRTFVQELVNQSFVKFYEACGKDKNKPGSICVQDFKDLTVTMLQAQGLAKLYAHNKSDSEIQCKIKPRVEIPAGPNPTIAYVFNKQYLQCTSRNGNKNYEFQFNSVDGNLDNKNHKNFKKGICKIFGSDYKEKKEYGHTWDICTDIKDEVSCNKIDSVISSGNIGYIASWGPANYVLGDRGYQITSTSLPYCVLTESVTNDSSGVLLFERTAFGLDGRVFLKAGIQRAGSEEIKKQIRTYVESVMGKNNVKSFSCEDTYHTVKLNGRSGTDDMLRCMVNDKVIEFFFDDLSESWTTYDNSGREAMNCIAWGGTFTGRKCIGLDETMCNIIRNANAESCPECRKITWNPKTNICELPASTSAENLKRGLTYSAIVGGTVASVVITIGTAGTSTTAVVLLGLETLGAGIELIAQTVIDGQAEEFFIASSNCNSESCAIDLVTEYLIKLSRMENDLSEAEANAADKELARLIGLIPVNSSWWIDSLRNADGTSLLETMDNDGWTVAQIWRALGIGLQFSGVLSSVTNWVIKKTGYLERIFTRTSKILVDNAKIAEKNIVKYGRLSAVDKEFYNLWKNYAPKNQTFEEFKAMSGGDIVKMREMVKNWATQDVDIYHKDVVEAEKFFEARGKIYNTNPDAKYLSDDELLQKYPDLKPLYENWKNANKNLQQFFGGNISYSTYDAEFNKFVKPYIQTQNKLDAEWGIRWQEYIETDPVAKDLTNQIDEARRAYKEQNPNLGSEDFHQTDVYKNLREELNDRFNELNKDLTDKINANRRDFQFNVAEKFPLKNLGNLVEDRAQDFSKALEIHPEIRHYLSTSEWKNLSDDERLDIAQRILDAYSYDSKAGISSPDVKLDYNTKSGGYYEPEIEAKTVFLNPNAQMKYPDGMMNVLSHEHAHYVDYENPNKGALGEQFSHYAKQLYSNKDENGYRVALTEQSAYKVGPNVSAKVVGKRDYFDIDFATEDALEDAIEMKKIAEEAENSVGAATTVGTVSGGAVVVGKKISHDNKESKDTWNKTLEDLQKEDK